MRRATLLAVLAGLILPTALWARQNIVLNGSMERGDGPAGIDPMVAAEWTEFGTNVERSPTVSLVPPGDGHSLKAFGDADSNSAGAFQEVADIAAGQSVVASVQLYSPAFDKLRASGEAGLVLEFLNLFGGTIDLHEVYVMDAAAPADTWILAEIGPLAAPAGTTAVRITCRLQWNVGDVLGAAYWDDAQFSVDDGPNLLVNSDFETEGFSSGQSPVGIDEWLGFNDQEKSDDFALDRAFSVKLGTEEPYSGLFQNMGVLSAGDRIYLQAYVLHPSSDPLVGNSRVGLKLEFDPNVEVPPPAEALTFD
ncbi:MAG: hypothetical protein MI702_06645, partial [Chlorobiales bacterium]|nr:hypothetical protein [Chlorobiales bacterium]